MAKGQKGQRGQKGQVKEEQSMDITLKQITIQENFPMVKGDPMMQVKLQILQGSKVIFESIPYLARSDRRTVQGFNKPDHNDLIWKGSEQEGYRLTRGRMVRIEELLGGGKSKKAYHLLAELITEGEKTIISIGTQENRGRVNLWARAFARYLKLAYNEITDYTEVDHTTQDNYRIDHDYRSTDRVITPAISYLKEQQKKAQEQEHIKLEAKVEGETINYSLLSWGDLKEIAKQKGIKVKGNKEELLQKIMEG